MLALILWSTLGSFLRVAIVSFVSAYGNFPEYIVIFFAQIPGILSYSLVSKFDNFHDSLSPRPSPNAPSQNAPSQNALTIPSNSQTPSSQNQYFNLEMKESFLVGFCGSLTTFSTFMTDIAKQFAIKPKHRDISPASLCSHEQTTCH